MTTKIFSFTIAPALKKILLVLGLLFLVLILAFSSFYLLSDYNALVQWYLSLGGCFYKQADWTTNFFTPAVKQSGNIYASLSMALCIVGVVWPLKRWKKIKPSHLQFQIATTSILWYIAVTILALSAGIWGWNLMLPANDEVFSAVECTEQHPIRLLSYYMLPNNHIYFNFINKTLFSWFGDFVQSGRLISLLAYIATLLVVFRFLSRLISNQLLAFIALLPIALQFHTWGFAAQARGYELQLLYGWLSLTSLYSYVIRDKEKMLYLNTVCNIIGFLLIPSYLYFYLAQLAYIAIKKLFFHRINAVYYIQQLILFSAVFIFYSPAILFSGAHSITSNSWVTPIKDNIPDYLPLFMPTFTRFIIDCFSGVDGFASILCYIFFAAPLTLFLSKDKRHKNIALFYLTLWVIYIVYSIWARRTPFHRTLIIHFSITMAYCIYTYYLFVRLIAKSIKKQNVSTVFTALLFTLPVASYSYYQYTFNRDSVFLQLYGTDVNGAYNAQTEGLQKIPSHSTISFTDQTYYYYYRCRKINHQVHSCNTGTEQYHIKAQSEPLPKTQIGAYKYLTGCGDDYEIFKLEQ